MNEELYQRGTMWDFYRVTRGDVTGTGPLIVFAVAVRKTTSRRKRKQDVVHACLGRMRSFRREMHPHREMRMNAAWCRQAWLHAKSGAPSACRCGATMLMGDPELCPFCQEARG